MSDSTDAVPDGLADALAQDWVEIAERCEPGRLVLKALSSTIAPSRMPRRRLCLGANGDALLQAGSANDALETQGHGHWSCRDDVLSLTLPGWEGDYHIEALEEETLIITQR